MSIASLGLINQINLNNVAIGSNGQPQNGNYANLYMSNDLDINGEPGCTYNYSLLPSTDPNAPNAMTLVAKVNRPNEIDNIPILIHDPTQGGNIGNGSLTGFSGDVAILGDVIIPIKNALSLATDSDGNIIEGEGGGGSSAYSWNLGNAIFTDNTFGDTTPTSQSYAVIDPNTRIVSIFLNVALTLVGSYTNQFPLLTINTNTSWTPSSTGTLPPPSALFQSLLPAVNNTVATFSGINLINFSTTPNFTPLCTSFYMSAYFANTGLINIRGLQQVSATNSQRVIWSGVMQYPY